MKGRVKERIKRYKELQEKFWAALSEYKEVSAQTSATFTAAQDWDEQIEELKRVKAIKNSLEDEIDRLQDQIAEEIDFLIGLLYETGLKEIKFELDDAVVHIEKEGDPKIIYKPGQQFNPKKERG